MKPAFILLLLWLAAGSALAGLPELLPFTATYRITVNGIPAGTAATVKLQSMGGTRHELGFRVENRFFSHHELSRFDWQDCHATAREYRHEFHGLGIDRSSNIYFDWVRRVAIESRDEQRIEMPLEKDISDGVSMAMMARCRLKDGARTLDFPVLYRGERKELHFTVVGEETVDTAIGTFRASILERRYPQRLRRTRVWVAPDLDWMMVRFEHVENPAARGSLLMTGLTLGDRTIEPSAGKRGTSREKKP